MSAEKSELRNRHAMKGKPTETSTPLTETEAYKKNRRDSGIFTIKLTLFLLCFGLFTWYFWPWGTKADPPEFRHSHIMNLNTTTFEPHVIKEDGKFRIVKFYANWCDHCKSLAPLWADIALKNQSPDVEFLQVECSKNMKLCRKADVKGFPHIKIFYQGRIGYSRIGAMNETELSTLVHEGVKITRQGQLRTQSEEIERLKDAEADKTEL